MIQSYQFLSVVAVTLVVLLMSPPSLQGQDDQIRIGVERTVYDVPPRLLNRPEVLKVLEEQYPSELREAAISGSVVLWLFVDDAGAVSDVMVHKGSDHDAFDDASLVVAKTMKFSPGLMDDEPVGGWILQRVDFNIR